MPNAPARPRPTLFLLTLAPTVLGASPGAGAQTLPPGLVDAIQFRSIGPANMSGRITEIAVYEPDPSIWYVATASGGLLKTTNNGLTFEHQFDRQSTVSIGDVAVSQTDPDLVWVGTGEHNPRNSVSWGDGVYKSTDGGKTWEHKGLEKTFQIGDVVIHPADNNVVLVAAMGRCWGANLERGVFKTVDGGDTWEKVLFVDDKTGAIELAMHPHNPDILLCAMWERQRDEFDTNDPAKRFGPGSGLYRTADGGATWTRIAAGLPTVSMGRMGIDWSRSEEHTVYALVDSERIGEGIPNAGYAGLTGLDADAGARIRTVVEDGPAAKAGLKENDIVVELGGVNVANYDDLLSEIRVHPAGTTAPVTVVREGEILTLEITFAENPNPEQKPFSQDLDGQRGNIMNQQGEDGFQTGGLFRSTDAGETWARVNSVNPRPMYFSEVRIDPSDPNYQWVLGVVMQKSEDGGKTFTRESYNSVHADHHAMWIDPRDGRHMILGTDGGLYVTHDRGEHWDHRNNAAIGQFYHVATDNRPLYRVFGGLQDNGSWGGPNRTRTRSGPDNTDWFRVGGGDGFLCDVDPDDPDQVYASSQNGGIIRYNIRTGEQSSIRPRAPRGTEYRFNWKTPFTLSHHNHRIYYAAGNYLFRSIDRGDDMEVISPEITRTNRGSATALAESPLDPGVIYVGSDDGSLWVTRDGGFEWSNIVYPREPDPEPEKSEEQPNAAEAAQGEPAAPEPPAPPVPPAPPTEQAEQPATEAQPDAAGEERPPSEPAQPEAQAPPEGEAQAEQTETEQPDRPAGRGAIFQRLDANGDGKLTGEEIPERMRGALATIDTDGDGALSETEFVAAAQRRTRRPGGAEGGPPGAPRAAGPGQAGERRGEDRPSPSPRWRIVPLGGEPEPPAPAPDPDDPIAGEWEVIARSERGERETVLFFKRLEGGALELSVTSQFLDATTRDVTFDPETGALAFTLTSDFGATTGAATIEGEKLSGTMTFGEGRFTSEISGSRKPAQEAAEAKQPNLRELLPGPGRFSSIEASRHAEGRVYITVDRHYYDDDKPYVFTSDDHGLTWRPIGDGLPDGSAKVIREDLVNPRLLYLGTEFGLWVSIDAGATWTGLGSRLPTVAVFEVAQHPTNGEIVLATHGRSLWAADVTPLRGLTERALSSPAFLLPVNDVILWHSLPSSGDAGGDGWYTGENPSQEAHICFIVKESPREFSLRVTDIEGRVVREFTELEVREGLNSVRWDLRRAAPAGAPQGRFRRAPTVPANAYRVDLEADGMQMTRSFRVLPDPEYAE